MAALSPDRWQRLEELFIAALDLPVGERVAFVAREAAGDAPLAHALTGMLASSPGAGTRIAAIVETAAGSLAPGGAWAGRRIGPYRVIREIGRGGMGLVFEAVRDDDEYRKRVALKVAPWWRDTDAVRERFRLERQILAELEHPHIARFLDGGTDGGLPYFVMEYVEGRPIAAFCEDRRLDVRQRLELFRLVCHAVRAAHERLVVHRDLKPANILVGEDGSPKLLDFGIAKLLDPVADPGVTAGEPVWTPDYASPEQVRGRAVTTRTDVYSLGLVLYEILAGARAQHADRSSPLALDRSICETDPPLPSVSAAGGGDRERARRLRGDLDTIVMTAIRKEPERRYGSVGALADDLGRYLEGRPIQARPGTPFYRAGKLLRRHALGTAAAALVVASVAAGTATTAYQARRAERRFDQVRALANAFVFDVHDRIEPLAGATEARKAIVQTALTYLESLQGEAGGDAALARELAAAYDKVGTVQGHPLSANLGDTPGALASYGRATALLEPLVARGDRAAIRQLAAVSRNLAFVHQAGGDTPTMSAAYDKAIALAQRAVDLDSTDAEALGILSEAASGLARWANQAREFTVAERASRQAVAAAERLVALDPAGGDGRETLATAHNTLGGLQLVTGRLEEAASSFRASVAIREQLVADDPDNASRRRTLMISYGGLGDVLGYRVDSLGDYAGARDAFERAVAIAAEAMKVDPSDRRAQFDAASARLRLGDVLAEDPTTRARGIEELREALRLTDGLVAVDPAASDRYMNTGLGVLVSLGEALADANQTADAAATLERVRAEAPAFLSGSTARQARVVMVQATLALAAIRARARDPRAAALAAWVAQELATPVVSPVVLARQYGSLGRVYLEMAATPSRESAALARTALVAFEKSAALWREATVPKVTEWRRTEALAALETDVAAARRLATQEP
jgi:tetratricopeptide (TPR) repeat protein